MVARGRGLFVGRFEGLVDHRDALAAWRRHLVVDGEGFLVLRALALVGKMTGREYFLADVVVGVLQQSP